MRTPALAAALCMTAPTVHADVHADAPAELSISAYRLGVVDVEQSAEFYARHFGLTMVMHDPGRLGVLIDEAGAYLVITDASAPAPFERGASAAHINFAVPDLDEAVAALEDEGVELVSRDESAVGRYATFVDPSGHRNNVKQLAEGVASPRIYNAGISVPDMPGARAFYEGLLGFSPIDGYYPPVVPMARSGAHQFILSEKDTSANAAYDHGTGALAGLAFEAHDIDAAMAALRDAGVEFLDDAPRYEPPVLCAVFLDPFGNAHELVEHIAPPPTDEDLAWLEGTWRSESNGGVVEENWFAPSHGNITGMLRWINAEGEVTLLELLTINTENGRPVFRWRHFDAELTPWASEADGPSIVTIESFDNNTLVMHALPGAPGVQRMTYDGSVEGTLTATLEFAEDSGRNPIVIVFERQ